MKNVKLSKAVEHDLKAAIKDGQAEIREGFKATVKEGQTEIEKGFRTGKEPNWKAIEADMNSRAIFNPNTFQKHIDFANKRHTRHCEAVGIEPEIVSHDYDKYDTVYKKGVSKYVIKNNIIRMRSIWQKTKDKNSSERLAYYQKVKGSWDRRNRRSSKYITSQITETASLENISATSWYVELLNLGPKPCLECIALQGIYTTGRQPKLPIHAGCYCEYRPASKREKIPAAEKPIKVAPIAIPKKKTVVSKDKVRKGLEGTVFKISSNKPLNTQETETVRALQLRLSPKYRQKKSLMSDMSQDNFISFAKDEYEAGDFMKHRWPADTGGMTYSRRGEPPKIITINKYRRTNTIHEIGHVVDYRMNPEVRSAVKDCWRAKVDVKKTSKISAYSLTDEEEYFAESFQAYVRQPTKLKKVDKNMYDIIKNDVFDGFEWT